jgi:hypothetical protein
MQIPEYLCGLLVLRMRFQLDAQVFFEVVPTADQNQFGALVIQ